MKPLLWVLLGVALTALVFVVVVVLSKEDGETPEQIATQVARDWTSEQVGNISDVIALQVTGGIPGVSNWLLE